MQTGDIVGKYRILDQIGKGGEGEVFLAVHIQTEQLWTLKHLKKDHAGRLHEVEMLRKLHHPGLPVVVDVLETSDGIFMVMEYIRGRNLEQLTSREGHLTPEQAVVSALELCSALEYLHTRKRPVLHLDLKPANVMLTQKGKIRLLDFGAAERMRENRGLHRGTDGFAAPEQYNGRSVLDQRTDIYGVGAVLYYLISGKACEKEGIRGRIQGCPAPVERVIRRCLAADPGERYSSCKELRKALAGCRKKTRAVRRRLHTEAAVLLCILTLMAVIPYMRSGFYSKAEEVFDYGRTLFQAACARDEQRLDLYRKAIYMEPSNPAAYEQMLEEAATDGIFDEEEELQFRKIQNTIPPGSSRTNQELLEEDPQAGAAVAWKLGLLYRFAFQRESAPRIAHGWFMKAQELSERCEQVPEWAGSAALIDRLSGYSSLSPDDLGMTEAEKAGDWWKALMKLDKKKLQEQVSPPLMLRLTLDCMNKMLTNIAAVHLSGIEPDELETGLDMLVDMADESIRLMKETQDPQVQQKAEEKEQREEEIRIQIRQLRKQKGA